MNFFLFLNLFFNIPIVLNILEYNSKAFYKPEFDYILNPGDFVCQDTPFILIYVHSSPQNFKNRNVIRDTYSKRSEFNDIRLIFMLGRIMVMVCFRMSTFVTLNCLFIT